MAVRYEVTRSFTAGREHYKPGDTYRAESPDHAENVPALLRHGLIKPVDTAGGGATHAGDRCPATIVRGNQCR